MMKARIAEWCKRLPVGEVAGGLVAALGERPRVVVTAPPGAGKSTLLPLVLAEAFPEGKVLMLEPRRVAAQQVAMRMAEMLGERVGETVGYRIRFETRVSAKTRIEVITEGILERMLIDDPTLEGYATVIFDEFHERSLASDVALALTRQAQELVRDDLRIVVMSATIDADALCRQLDAPLIESRGKAFGVEMIYADTEDVARVIGRALRERKGDILVFLPGKGEISRCQEALAGLDGVEVVPLHGLLSPQEQRRAIMPSSSRRIVLATPIAETSLTIQGVTTVIDSGLYRRQRFEPSTSMSRLVTETISLDMATQRAGRAGRLGPGVCYRLWSRPAESRMEECRKPEILSADLAPMVLAVAAWGESDPSALPWVTPPPGELLKQAQALLRDLGAIDLKGAITSHGRRLSALPCHPRIANMLTLSDDQRLKALAADIAAILDERDIFNDDDDADLTNRIVALRHGRRRWPRVAAIAEQYRRLVGVREDNGDVDPFAVGELLAHAYPERIAMAADDGIYRVAGGGNVSLSDKDDLSAQSLLAVATMGKRIFLAAPLSKEAAAKMGHWVDTVRWDAKAGRVAARRDLRVGALAIATKPLDNVSRSDVLKSIADAAPKSGRSMFDFNDDFRRMQQRLETLREWHPEFEIPATGIDELLASAAEWLPMYAPEASTAQELRKIDMSQVLWGMLPYDLQQTALRLVPERIQLPGGRSVRIDYRPAASAPVVSARLQDCFGMLETPRLDDGRRPVLMELLSPGFKPVQLTSDMPGFWRTTYFDVRKELRRRYPKHRWPDNPLDL